MLNEENEGQDDFDVYVDNSIAKLELLFKQRQKERASNTLNKIDNLKYLSEDELIAMFKVVNGQKRFYESMIKCITELNERQTIGDSND